MTQSSCKRDTKSRSHPGMKLTLVRVFSSKHPLTPFKIMIISYRSPLLKVFAFMVLVYLSRLFSTTNHYFTLVLKKEAYLNFVHRKPE